MDIECIDFKGADTYFDGPGREGWNELSQALAALPLHIKESDQAGIQGRFIFDPVGTNRAIGALLPPGWAKLPLPTEYKFLGNDVDFAKAHVVVEVQFSNYPFLINNIYRADFLHAEHIAIPGLEQTSAAIVVTKGGIFPASNSTLYFEQARNSLQRHFLFEIPTRVVGLVAHADETLDAVFTTYANRRTSRTIVTQRRANVGVVPGRGRRAQLREL